MPIVNGRKLRNLREKLGLSQADLAYNAELAVRTIRRLESGDLFAHSFTVRKISEVLRVENTELILYTEASIQTEENRSSKAPRILIVVAPEWASDERIRSHITLLRDLGYQVSSGEKGGINN
jgi:transcriptional regulator with XRE-family HTH domain